MEELEAPEAPRKIEVRASRLRGLAIPESWFGRHEVHSGRLPSREVLF
jgi:hypothetical protein